MELVNQDTKWFFSEEGCKKFSSLTNLEERSVFLYSYLRTVADPSFEENQILFKTAFFLADAIMGSNLPYSKYPELINPMCNPFVTYLKRRHPINTEQIPQIIYCVYLAILHDFANPIKKNKYNWTGFEDSLERIQSKLESIGKPIYLGKNRMVNPDLFEIDDSLQVVQLKLIWLFGQHK